MSKSELEMNESEDVEATLKRRYPYQFAHLEYGLELPKGWLPLVASLCSRVHAALSPEERGEFFWIQIKEKFGGLRAYNACPESACGIVDDIVGDFEVLSLAKCEVCGRGGAVRSESRRGWVHTVCPAHRE